MHAWTISGDPTPHPEPWGQIGAFSTLRLFPNRLIPFRCAYLARLLESATLLQLPWIPELALLKERLDQYLSKSAIEEGLIRICLFENSIGISGRPARSDGKPVNGRLLQYRRPIPRAKSTQEKELYGRLSKLDISTEDWIINDPKENEIRESATSNLIFVRGDSLIIPEKQILPGVILSHLLPALAHSFRIIRATPKAHDLSQYNEILLCGTGRGVAPLSALSELNWSSSSDAVLKQVRLTYENLLKRSDA